MEPFGIDELQFIIGESVKRIRLNKNVSRESVCEQAGISMNALRHLEDGSGASTKTLLSVVIAFNRQDWVKSLAPIVSINPLTMVRGGGTRKRASRNSTKAKSGLEHKSKYLMETYSITVDQYIAMHKFQNEKCGNSGCDTVLDLMSSSTHVDHCHATGKVRSLMCNQCNTALGMLKEDDKRISGLSEYVKKHNSP